MDKAEFFRTLKTTVQREEREYHHLESQLGTLVEIGTMDSIEAGTLRFDYMVAFYDWKHAAETLV